MEAVCKTLVHSINCRWNDLLSISSAVDSFTVITRWSLTAIIFRNGIKLTIYL